MYFSTIRLSQNERYIWGWLKFSRPRPFAWLPCVRKLVGFLSFPLFSTISSWRGSCKIPRYWQTSLVLLPIGHSIPPTYSHRSVEKKLNVFYSNETFSKKSQRNLKNIRPLKWYKKMKQFPHILLLNNWVTGTVNNIFQVSRSHWQKHHKKVVIVLGPKL